MQAKTSLGNEGEIQQLIDNWTNALRARDLNKLMSQYAPDFVGYDAIPPLQAGANIFKKNWGEYFNYFPGPVDIETRDFEINAGNNVAFTRGLVNLKGTKADGKQDAGWMRATTCYEKIDGKWLISHEHWSMPFDIETLKVRTDLKPT
jgi:ketosteroid isomerase-like protein